MNQISRQDLRPTSLGRMEDDDSSYSLCSSSNAVSVGLKDFSNPWQRDDNATRSLISNKHNWLLVLPARAGGVMVCWLDALALDERMALILKLLRFSLKVPSLDEKMGLT